VSSYTADSIQEQDQRRAQDLLSAKKIAFEEVCSSSSSSSYCAWACCDYLIVINLFCYCYWVVVVFVVKHTGGWSFGGEQGVAECALHHFLSAWQVRKHTHIVYASC